MLCQFHLSITLSIRVKPPDFISRTLFSVIKWKFKRLLSLSDIYVWELEGK